MENYSAAPLSDGKPESLIGPGVTPESLDAQAQRQDDVPGAIVGHNMNTLPAAFSGDVHDLLSPDMRPVSGSPRGASSTGSSSVGHRSEGYTGGYIDNGDDRMADFMDK